MYVAKSYENYTKKGDPFQENGRWYYIIDFKGRDKKVRAYTEVEYKKQYGGAAAPKSPVVNDSENYQPTPNELKWGGQKKALGFDKDYITIFKGYDEALHGEYFKFNSHTRYCVLWGWYVASTESVPVDLPTGITPIKLSWETVCKNPYNLADKKVVAAVVEPLLYGESPSKYQGAVGSRIDRSVRVIKAIPVESQYAGTTIFLLEDKDQNEYLWKTSAKAWKPGYETTIRGTVKEHNIYHGHQQTILTRCMEVI